MKTLYIISKGLEKPSDEEQRKLERDNRTIRGSMLEDAINATVLDERYLQRETGVAGMLYRYLPVSLVQLILALRLHKNFDLVYSYSEKVGFPLSVCFRLFNIKTPHVMMVSRITSADQRKGWWKQKLFQFGQKGVTEYIFWSSVQRNLAVEKLGVPETKAHFISRGTDCKFWHVIPRKTDMICSVGMEMRDYPTLIEALKPLDIPCHLATGQKRGELFDTVKNLYEVEEIPENVTVGTRNLEELRDLYARSRFVVVSVLPSDSDNGLTTILEAMAMGKPVIYTKTEGQVDIVEDGVTGIPVPAEDPKALRKAIQSLWNDPERVERMGAEARKYIEREQRMEDHVAKVKQILIDAVTETQKGWMDVSLNTQPYSSE